MDGSTDGTPHNTIEEKKQSWVAILIISYTNSRVFNKRKQARIHEDVSKRFDVTLKNKIWPGWPLPKLNIKYDI
jgi:hypothetical protein